VFVVQVLRAVAAILVILHHADKQAFSFGTIGVDAFFVVSGFVTVISTVRSDPRTGLPGHSCASESSGSFRYTGFSLWRSWQETT
jgi:peptidoglycan/LPS O-acetylase OafA/YrhL